MAVAHPPQGFPVRLTRSFGRPRDGVSLMLASLVLIGGLCTIGVAGSLMISGYSPTPYADQWLPLWDLAQGRSWFSPVWLWQQHNEHRIPLEKLALYADLRLFGGQGISLLCLIFITLFLHWILWAAFLKEMAAVPQYVWMSLTGFFAFCIFCPAAAENFYWPFQWSFVAVFFFASLSFISLTWFGYRRRPWDAVAWASAAACLAECCLANGLLVWPVLIIAAAKLRFSSRHRWTLASLACLSIGAFLYHFQVPSYHSSPLTTIRQPGRVMTYLLTYFDHPLSQFVSYPGMVAIALLGITVFALRLLLLKSSKQFAVMPLAMTMIFLLGTGLVTALGRLRLGMDQATVGRYQTPVLLFWACAFAVLMVAAYERASRRDILTLSVIGILVMALPVTNLKLIFQDARSRSDQLSSIGESLDQGALDPPIQASLGVGPPAPEQVANYFHKLGDSLGPTPILVPANLLRPSNRDNKGCIGSFDGVTSLARFFPGPKEVRADGWAIDLYTHRPVSLVVISDNLGRAFGATTTRLPRPDVLTAYPDASGSLGWRSYMPIYPGTTRLKAFAIIDGHACQIGAEQTLP